MKQLRLGITGCIGSGKSVVSAILRTLGIPVYDCDSEAKRVMHTNLHIRQELTNLFGPECYPDGTNLDRKHLAGIIFNDQQALQQINSIVHPRVKQDFEQWCTHSHFPIVALESAILFEAGLNDTVDCIVAVYAKEKTCITRACRRSNATRDEIKSRMKNQMPSAVIIKKSDFAICNDDDKALLPQIAKLLDKIKYNRN